MLSHTGALGTAQGRRGSGACCAQEVALGRDLPVRRRLILGQMNAHVEGVGHGVVIAGDLQSLSNGWLALNSLIAEIHANKYAKRRWLNMSRRREPTACR